MELLWVKARHLTSVPGRQTDVQDGAWIAQRLPSGLRRARVVPSAAGRPRRERTRHQATRLAPHTAVGKRVHQTLEDAQSTRRTVRSALRRVSGRRRRRAMAAGEDDGRGRAAWGHARWRPPPAALPASCPGTRRAPHRFMRTTLLEPVALLAPPIARLAADLEAQRRPGAGQRTRVDSLEGLARRGAQHLLAERGPEMAQCSDAGHLSRWAGLSPRAAS